MNDLEHVNLRIDEPATRSKRASNIGPAFKTVHGIFYQIFQTLPPAPPLNLNMHHQRTVLLGRLEHPQNLGATFCFQSSDEDLVGPLEPDTTTILDLPKSNNSRSSFIYRAIH
jgi:hypothetical protein